MAKNSLLHPKQDIIAAELVNAGIKNQWPEQLGYYFETLCRRLPTDLSSNSVKVQVRHYLPGLRLEAGRDDRRYLKRHTSLDAIFDNWNSEDDGCD